MLARYTLVGSLYKYGLVCLCHSVYLAIKETGLVDCFIETLLKEYLNKVRVLTTSLTVHMPVFDCLLIFGEFKILYFN